MKDIRHLVDMARKRRAWIRMPGISTASAAKARKRASRAMVIAVGLSVLGA